MVFYFKIINYYFKKNLCGRLNEDSDLENCLNKIMMMSAKNSKNSMNVMIAKPNQRPITPPVSDTYSSNCEITCNQPHIQLHRVRERKN